MINDSELFHGGNYDPAKARDYYLRTRKLKGRNAPANLSPSPGVRAAAKPTSFQPTGAKPNRANTKSRRAQLKARKAALEKRMDQLEEILQQAVEAAKGRSGVEKSSSDKAPETKKDKADRNAEEKKLSPKQKSDKAKAAKDAYEKENPNSLSKDIEILQEQVKDIRAKIQQALADARTRSSKAGKGSNQSLSTKQKLVQPQSLKTPNDGLQSR